MFTGLIDHCGTIKSIKKNEKSQILHIKTGFCDLSIGESIAVDGVCLTVTAFEKDIFCCEISPETQKLTLTQYYDVGRSVNLERALRLSDRLGGHFVMGHVDCLAVVVGKKSIEEYIEFTLKIEESAYLIPKGSIAVNGVSLTINQLLPESIKFMLIPHSQEKTNLAQSFIGDYVNIEFDWLAKLVNQSTIVEK